MSVRHINAKPEEYIAVHRNNGSRRSSSSGGDSGLGLAYLVGFIFLLFFWKVILKWTIILGTVALVAALLWWGRDIIIACLRTCLRATWRGGTFACAKSWSWLSSANRTLQNWYTSKHALLKATSRSSTRQHTANYGKIIQKMENQ